MRSWTLEKEPYSKRRKRIGRRSWSVIKGIEQKLKALGRTGKDSKVSGVKWLGSLHVS